MMHKKMKFSLTASSAVLAFNSLPAVAVEPGLAPWLVQMGETASVLSAANWGRTMRLGVIDTGIVANNPVFAAGQVSVASSSCAAVSFRCARGVSDDNGHGTAVASIAAANAVSPYTYSYAGYTVKANSFVGVAPNANIVAEKVLNSSGSGYSADISNGINKAVAAGVNVINLSLTFLPTPDIVAAINNAAAKGVFIVWAGGNDGRALLSNASTSGLTPAAIKRLVFAGALDASAAKLASFSNTPGSGALVSTSGTRTAYASRWITAPGTNILAPGIAYGPGAMALWSGTSMSAPLISGSLLLLESAWPILRTKGTAADLLLGTATDLGAKGTDSIYGTGLVNLTTAFAPVGVLAVTRANGTTVPVASLTGSMLTGGALGNLSAVKSALANYTALDGYERNFSVDLSGLIQTRATAARTNPLPSNLNTGVAVMKLADGGGEFSNWQSTTSTFLDRLGVYWNADAQDVPRTGYMAFTNRFGSTLSVGYGLPAQFTFAKALYGDSPLSLMAGESSSANLSDLAQGGYNLAYGMRVAQDTRLAVSFARTASSAYAGNPVMARADLSATALHAMIGVTRQFSERWSGGVSFGQLSENNGLLGSTYQSDSALALGANLTSSLGVSIGYALDRDNSLLAEAGIALTKAGSGEGLLSGTSDIRSQSYGVSWLSRNFLRQSGNLLISLKQPLRAVSGKVGVVMPSIDDDGVANYSTQMVSLVPSSREVDFKMSYDMPLGKTQTVSMQLVARQNVLNVAGNSDASIGGLWSAAF